VRFYSAEEVHAALSLPALADSIAEALRAGTVAPLRHAHALSDTDSLLLMPAWSARESGAIGVKLVTVLPRNRERGSSTVNALYVLFDRDTGEPRAVIEGEALTLRRTGAASLLAARYLARKDARQVLVVGTGRLARFMAHAHCVNRDIERLFIWGRSADSAQSLASTLRQEGLPAEAVDDLERAVHDSHIVSCATTATAPIVRGAWLAPGTHLDLVGAFKPNMREVDDDAVARASVYVDTFAGALAEAADIIEPIARGLITRADIRGELAELATGTAPGRSDAKEITLFKSVGTAIEDLAAAQLLVRVSGP
jgi:ornithine cyclodeaminase/alanine dehydrogenase-like protein (mu-crystallin family)